MNSPIFVVGHQNPDTDAICAALGYAAFLQEVRGVEASAICCGSIPERTQWVLSQTQLEAPTCYMHTDEIQLASYQFCLIDHNELAQSIPGIQAEQVVEVVDHHRLSGDIKTQQPIAFWNSPVGSSCTMVALAYEYAGKKPSRDIALCLVAGMISDTLCLTSPTTTKVDKRVLAVLADIADIEPQEFTENFFAQGSLLVNGDMDAILNTDRKEFNEGGKFITIAQIEEISLKLLSDRQDSIQQALDALRLEKGYDLALIAVTDILKHNSMILASGDASIIQSLPWTALEPTLLEAPGVVSRKKQLFPAVANTIASL